MENRNHHREYGKTRLFGSAGTVVFCVFVLLSAYFAYHGKPFGAAGAAGVATLALQSVCCLLLFVTRNKKSVFCFARTFYSPLGLTVYALLLSGGAAAVVLLSKGVGIGYLFTLLPAAAFFVTLGYRNLLFGKKGDYPLFTDYYLETVLTPAFFVNGADVFSEETIKTGRKILLLNPDTGSEFAEGEIVLVRGKDCDFAVAYTYPSEGIAALYLVRRGDYEKLCVVEGFDRHIAADRAVNQANFDLVDSPAFHEEGYFYTAEREVRFHVEQEEGAFCVVEEAVFWDRFFLDGSPSAAPYVWEVCGRDYFEYYKDATAFMTHRIKEADVEWLKQRLGQ